MNSLFHLTINQSELFSPTQFSPWEKEKKGCVCGGWRERIIHMTSWQRKSFWPLGTKNTKANCEIWTVAWTGQVLCSRLPLSFQSSVQVPELVFDVWCLSYNASVEPDLIPIFVFGHYSTAHIQLVSRRVVIIGNMVPWQKTLSFVVKFHLVLLPWPWVKGKDKQKILKTISFCVNPGCYVRDKRQGYGEKKQSALETCRLSFISSSSSLNIPTVWMAIRVPLCHVLVLFLPRMRMLTTRSPSLLNSPDIWLKVPRKKA